MQEILTYVKTHPILCLSFLTIVVLLLCVLWVYRETKLVMTIAGNAIVEAEQNLNSKTGQEKLEYATEKIRSKLPKYLSIFVTKSMIISLIEFMLNFIGKAFKIDKKIDIKGNE